eukprot:GFUD01032879.1.p1 GENE.GFUD01032879.1~~GFUD01032879.1.p1  ORF type:complete len:187 (-),score=38.88 GFUD01032879.1:180-740(-)
MSHQLIQQDRLGMAENTVQLRGRATTGRKSIYSRYVKESLYSFGKKKESKEQPKKKTRINALVNINKIDSDLDNDAIGADRQKQKEEQIKDLTKEDNNNHLSLTARPPPIPAHRKPPCSATAIQSRTTSDLDSALKQFRLSTAASRESLRSSRLDISLIEESVNTMMRSRPSTPVPERWRSRMMTL